MLDEIDKRTASRDDGGSELDLPPPALPPLLPSPDDGAMLYGGCGDHVSHGLLRRALATWGAQIQDAADALSVREASLAHHLGENRELALMQYVQDGAQTVGLVSFPKQSVVSVDTSQIVRVGSLNRVVFSAPAFRPWW